MKHFDLNIDKILEDWETHHAIRELIANALDERTLTGTVEPQVTKDSAGWWHIRDFGRGLRQENLIQSENPEKLSHPNIIGKFGIGLKDALATLERKGVRVLIRSRHGDISLARVAKHEFEEFTTLHATVSEPSLQLLVGTDCCLYGVLDAQVESAKRLFLAFDSARPLAETRYGSIYTRGEGPAAIYINGMKVAEEPNFLFSYNITSINAAIRKALNRERQNLGRTAFSDRVRTILLESESDSVAELIVQDLERLSAGNAHDELGWLDVQEHAVRILSAKRQVVFLNSATVMGRPDIIDSARSSGFEVVIVSDALARKVDGLSDIAGHPVVALGEFLRRQNESFEFRWVSLRDMSEREQMVWGQRDAILALIGGLPSVVKEVRISETMCATIQINQGNVGLWDGAQGWIILKRSVLESLEGFAGTLLHEALHAKYGVSDVSREFEYHLTEVCGRLAATVVRLLPSKRTPS